MSADSTDKVYVRLDEKFVEALVAHCKLTPESQDRISLWMREKGCSYVEAALQLGFVSPDDVSQVQAKLRDSSASRDRPGIIESLVERQTNAARALIVVPDVMGTPSRRLLLAYEPDHPHSERIRALRTELLLRNEPGPGANMLVLLSPEHGEGRSQLAAELAIAFSQLGRRTLLVDADLRRPRQHELFGVENNQGLTVALASEGPAKLASVAGFPDLSVLLAGPSAPNPSELLGRGQMERLLYSWNHGYDFVVVDTPPITQFSDGLITAALVGRALLVSRANVSKHRNMKDMMRRLVSTQSRILGSVINDF